MNTLLNYVSGRILAPIWDALDGKKTYLTGFVSILTGIAGLAAEIVPFLSSHDTVSLIALLRHLPSDPAYLMLLAGLGGLGIGHKLEKATDSVAR